MRASGSPPAPLARRLRLGSAVALVVGEVVGVGIFLTPAAMADGLRSPFWVLLVWVTMGTMAACGALAYGELAARVPEAGGGYAYLREAFGPRTAFLYGWKSLFVMDPGLTAALAMGLASYVAHASALGPVAQKSVAIGAIVAVALVNIGGVRFGAGLIRGSTALKVGLLGLIIVWGFGRQLGDWNHFVPFVSRGEDAVPIAGALSGGIVAAFFSFGGWWDAAKLGGEVEDPGRTLPRALLWGVAIVTLMYILTSAVFLYLVPVAEVTSGEAFAAQAGEILFGPAGGRVLAIVVVIAVLSSLASLMMAAPRVYYAMARDGVFPAAMAVLHPRFGTPARAIVLQAVLASILVLLGSFSQIVAYFIFVTVAFVRLTVAGLFVLRRRHPDATSRVPFTVPGYPVTPLIFLVLVAILLVMLAMQNPWQASLGTFAVALGLPAYHFAFRRVPTHGEGSR